MGGPAAAGAAVSNGEDENSPVQAEGKLRPILNVGLRPTHRALTSLWWVVIFFLPFCFLTDALRARGSGVLCCFVFSFSTVLSVVYSLDQYLPVNYSNFMKTIIAGGRDIWDYSLVESAIAESGFEISEVFCGMAGGVDAVGWAWARINGVPVEEFYADWNNLAGGIRKTNKWGKQYNPLAGFQRNERMAMAADALIAVWDGESRGTKHMIEAAESNGLRVFVQHTAPLTRSINPTPFLPSPHSTRQGNSW